MRTASVTLHYVHQGRGPAILFLHGFPEFWYAWKDLLPDFATDHHAITMDLRGYNLSSAPPNLDDYKIPLLIADVRELVMHLGAAQITLVGHDWGGVVAWAFAAAHPDLLNQMVIINAPHPAILTRLLATDVEQQRASNYFNLYTSSKRGAEELLSQDDFGALRRVVLAGWASTADCDRYLECWRRGLTGGLNYYRAANLRSPMSVQEAEAGEFAHVADHIRTPTLVIWGERDFALMAQNLNGLERYAKRLSIHRIPDAGHWVVHERAAEVISAIRHFLAPQNDANVD